MFQNQLKPVADDFAAIAVALLAVPNGESHRDRFAGNESASRNVTNCVTPGASKCGR